MIAPWIAVEDFRIVRAALPKKRWFVAGSYQGIASAMPNTAPFRPPFRG